MMNIDPARVKADLCLFFKKEKLGLADRWIVSRFYSVLGEIEKDCSIIALTRQPTLSMGFFWHEFCDWYLELIKPEIHAFHHQVIMYKVLENSCGSCIHLCLFSPKSSGSGFLTKGLDYGATVAAPPTCIDR